MPLAISKLKSLFNLNLYYNRLEDPLPPEIGNLQSLTNLFLHWNMFTASAVPSTLPKLTKLEYLLLHFSYHLYRGKDEVKAFLATLI